MALLLWNLPVPSGKMGEAVIWVSSEARKPKAARPRKDCMARRVVAAEAERQQKQWDKLRPYETGSTNYVCVI